MSTPTHSESSANLSFRQHITRLPSSSFLRSNLSDKLLNQVRIVTFNLRQDSAWFLKSWRQATQASPATPSVVWCLFQECENDKTLQLIAQTVASPLSSADNESSKLETRRQGSGMLNQKSILESAISQWIGRVQLILEKPCTSNHLVIVMSSMGHSVVEDKRFSVCLESIRVRVGLEAAFSVFLLESLADEPERSQIEHSEAQLMTKPKLSLQSAILGEIGIKLEYVVFQDISDTVTFRVLYYVTERAHMLAVRETCAWIMWRRRVASYLSGAPRVINLDKLLHSKQVSESTQMEDELEETHSPETRTQASTPCQQTIWRNDIAHHTIEYITDLSLEVADLAVSADPRFENYKNYIRSRYERFLQKAVTLMDGYDESVSPVSALSSIKNYDRVTRAHEEFGLHRSVRDSRPGYVYREIVGGNPRAVYFYGDFNQWNPKSHPMTKVCDEPPTWEIFVVDGDPEGFVQNLQKFKFLVERQDGSTFDRVSPWVRLVWESAETHLMDGLVCDDENKNRYYFKNPRPPVVKDVHPRIYEVHVGLASEEASVGTYRHVKTNLLQRLLITGFDCILLTGILEHSNYALAGWHVSNYFAPSSRFGTPDHLKELIDEAHGLGIKVLLSVIYTHAGPEELDGLGNIDDTDNGIYFRSGLDRRWDGRVFDYKKMETMKFLLSNMRYWLEEFMFDGFRFEGLESILYKDHAVNNDFDRYNYANYFTSNADTDGAAFLMVANDVIHWILPQAITIGRCNVGTPALATPLSRGGLGFDYTMSCHLPAAVLDLVDRYTKHQNFSLNALRFALDRMSTEKRVGAIETLETATIAKRPMKIAFMAWETLHTIAVGGIAPHVTELAAALRRIGHELHVYTRATGISDTVSVHYGVYYHEVTFHLNRDFIQECRNMCDAFVRAIQDDENESNKAYTLIHGHDWLVGHAVASLKGTGRTLVFTMHSTEAGRCGNQVFGGQSQRIRDIEASACHAADRVICVSGVLADEVKNFYNVHPEKIRVVYNGCNVHNFDGFEDAAPIKERYGIKPLEPTILFVGRFVVQKGVDLLVEAVPHILQFRNDVKFVIVGDGHMRTDVEARARHLDVMHALRFLGSRGGAELKSLYKMCDAVAVPSRNEPFGIVVLEAWSAYKPVIATTCGGPRDFVSPNSDGFLVDPNPSSIAWGCCEVLKNFDHARWMGEQGRLKATNSFSWDTIGTQTVNIYYELINRGDVTYGMTMKGDCTLAQRIIGHALYSHMGIFDDDTAVKNGLALLRLLQLALVCMGSEGLMYPIGSDFAHPDWIDFPRPGNNFSQDKARIQWGLATKKSLKYKHIFLFTRWLMKTASRLKLNSTNDIYVPRCVEDDKVLAVERESCLIVFNFHPCNDYRDYGIGHSIESPVGGLRLLMDTDEVRYGGLGRLSQHLGKLHINGNPLDKRAFSITIPSLPSRCAMVFTSQTDIRVSCVTPDELIDELFAQ